MKVSTEAVGVEAGGFCFQYKYTKCISLYFITSQSVHQVSNCDGMLHF